jgi:cell division protein FtsQ
VTATRERVRPARGRVEPRLAERRRSVVDTERQRRRRTLVIVGIVVAVVAVMVTAVFSPLLDVDHVEVQGAESVSLDEVLEVAGVATGERMVEVDLAETRDALRSMVRVRSAHVTRDWPSTIRVVITEEVPAAVLRGDERAVVVSTTGRVLDLAPDAVGGLVSIDVEGSAPWAAEGPGAEVPEGLLAAALVVHRMNDQLRAEVSSGQVTESGYLSFELTDGATVRFGAGGDLSAKLGATEAVLSQVAPQCRQVIDVREPSRVTVSRKAGCEGPEVTDTSLAEEYVEG